MWGGGQRRGALNRGQRSSRRPQKVRPHPQLFRSREKPPGGRAPPVVRYRLSTTPPPPLRGVSESNIPPLPLLPTPCAPVVATQSPRGQAAPRAILLPPRPPSGSCRCRPPGRVYHLFRPLGAALLGWPPPPFRVSKGHGCTPHITGRNERGSRQGRAGQGGPIRGPRWIYDTCPNKGLLSKGPEYSDARWWRGNGRDHVFFFFCSFACQHLFFFCSPRKTTTIIL